MRPLFRATGPKAGSPVRRSVRLSVEALQDRTVPTLLGADLGALLGQSGPVYTPPPMIVFPLAPAPLPVQTVTVVPAPAAPVAPAGDLPPQSGPVGDCDCTEEGCPVLQASTDRSRVTDFSFFANGTQVPNLDGLQQGDTVRVNFTVTAGEPVKVSLASYTAPTGSYDATVAYQEQIFQAQTGTFAPGTYSLEVKLPDSFFQVDFVTGDVIPQFSEYGGPNFYGATDRLIEAGNGGTTPFAGVLSDPWERPASYSYTVNGVPVADLTGNVNSGDEVTVTFTVPDGELMKLSLVSYVAPTPQYDDAIADQQRIYEAQTGTFGPGTHSLTVTVPDSCYQVEFVNGDVIPVLGPAGSSNFYGSTGRLIDTDTGGKQAADCGCDDGTGGSVPGTVPQELPAGFTTMTTTVMPFSYPGKDLFAIGSGAGGTIQAFDAATGQARVVGTPYGAGFTGGIVVATGDVNGDGYDDLVTVPAAGNASLVMVWSGADFGLLRSFLAYGPGFTGGVSIAVGDLNGDGKAEIITGAGPGGGAHVKVFDGATGAETASFFAYDPGFAGGVRVAVGDVDGDGRADIITGTVLGASHVKVFSGVDLTEVASFFAFQGGSAGVWVAAGDVDGDGVADVLAAPGKGGVGIVRVLDARTGGVKSQFDAFGADFLGGVAVAATDYNGDGRADIVAGTESGASVVKVLDGLTGQVLATPLDAAGLSAGVYVG